jgi:hypothetical protein
MMLRKGKEHPLMTTVVAQRPAMPQFRLDADQRSDVIAYPQRLGP